MSHRYRFIGSPLNDQHWQIVGEELHHLRKVLRLPVGEGVEVTDGHGSWAAGILEEVQSQVAMVVCQETQREPPPSPRLLIGIGALRPGAIDDILPSLVELGMHEIHIFSPVGAAKARIAEAALSRWSKIILASIKQCKRAWLPELHVHPGIDALIARTTDVPLKWVLDPNGSRSLPEATHGRSGDRMAIIGSEAGLHHQELEKLTGAGFEPVTCGRHILRAVTAAIAAAAILGVNA